MPKLLFIFISVFLSYCSYAQNTLSDTIFFNRKWERTTNRKKVRFYRPPIHRLVDGRYEIKDYYADNNQLQMWAVFNDTAATSDNGFSRFYYKNGQLESEDVFVNCILNGHSAKYNEDGVKIDEADFTYGSLEGNVIKYFANGFKKQEAIAKHNQIVAIKEYYDSNKVKIHLVLDTPGIKNGRFTAYYKSGKLMGEGIMKDGKLVTFSGFSPTGVHIDNNPFDRSVPKYPKEDYQKYCERHINYPVECWKKTIEGVVIVHAYFDEKGKIYKADIKQGIHPLIDAEAVRVLKKMPEWEPALNNDNRPVKSELELMVPFYTGKFQLANQ